MPPSEEPKTTDESESTDEPQQAAESSATASAAKAEEVTVADAGEPRGAGEAEGAEDGDGRAKRESRGVDRRGLVACAALVAACAGLVLYGVLDTEEKPERHVPTASVTYEVDGEGTADLTYQARSDSGTAVEVNKVDLPWKKTVQVPLGKPPLVTITLDEKGGRASCRLAIRGKHVQTATAFGKFGRATCQGELAAPETTEDAAVPANTQGEQ
ncbi:hypothetical protein [Streptomyces yanii]|uniref:MmpS family membrane protein n=1 Tax=Streptomyces yanii TaxID=78510 RepID=A0ABV5R158_9ACTN